MLIRSKNKMHIVNIENGVVSAEGDGTLTFRAGKIRVVLGETCRSPKSEMMVQIHLPLFMKG